MPVVASLPDFNGKIFVISIMSLVVALLSSVATFFHWHETWRVNSQSLMEFEHLLASWEVKMILAEKIPEVEKRVISAVLATEELLAAAARVDKANTQGFFKNVKMPHFK